MRLNQPQSVSSVLFNLPQNKSAKKIYVTMLPEQQKEFDICIEQIRDLRTRI